MDTYEFTLKFSLQNEMDNPEGYVERLGAAGCDDALIGIGQRGRIAFNFIRQANSARDAVVSAVKDIQKVIPDATLVEASPDIVGLTDVADLLGFSRQYMRKLMIKSGSAFPVPLHEGKASIWHLARILAWFKESGVYQIDDTLIDIANINMQFNLMVELTYVEPAVHDDIRALMN